MNWEKIDIKTENGEFVKAQSPIIVSASRSTDIPAFYSDWFVNRLKHGYVKWRNPFNGVPLYVSFKNARLVVFWSKNPKPLIKHLDYISDKIPNFYFQYTLNDYDDEKLEPGVPSVDSRIKTFIELSEKIGKEKVIWRFDPLILTDRISVDDLLRKIENLGDKLHKYTEKLVFSFADIESYKKVKNNLIKGKVNYKEFDEDSMIQFAKGLQKFNERWKLDIGTCAEKIPLEKYGIIHNKCVDDDLIIKLFPNDSVLMNFLGYKGSQLEFNMFDDNIKKPNKLKDKGQRELCGCIFSKDIGEYNTCPHLCEYCYANASKEIALSNWKRHKQNPNSEMIKGE